MMADEEESEGRIIMKIAAFYENILQASRASGISVPEILQRLKDLGMDNIYLTPDSWKMDEEMLRETLPKIGLGIEGMHCWVRFTEDPETTLYQDYIDLALSIGAKNILLIPGMLSGGNTVRDLERMVAGMKKAVAYGQEKGLPVTMEDFDSVHAPNNCIAGLKYFTDSVPGLAVAFDTGNFAFFQENELEALPLFEDRIATLHLKDRSLEKWNPNGRPFVRADGSPVYSCPVGSGCIHIREVVDRMKELGYDGGMIAEVGDWGDDRMLEVLEESVRWLKTLA